MTSSTRALIAMILAIGCLVTSTGAQQPSTPYTLRLTKERAERFLAAWNTRAPYVPGELIVKFREGAAPATRTRALSVLRQSSQISQVKVVGEALLLQTPGEPDSEAAAAVLLRQPEVEWARPNYLRPLHATPNDPSFDMQWNFTLLGLPAAWDINPGANAGVRVAIIDTGVTTVTTTFTFRLWTGSRFEQVPIPYRVNPDIATARILPGRDFVLWDGPVLDMNGHGTHVAGTALQETNNRQGVAGIAYGATLLPLKACFGFWDFQIVLGMLDIPGFADAELDGACDDVSVAEAIRYAADNGAQVINLSLGGPDPAPIQLDALRYAVQKGVFVAIAAGNEFADGNPVEYPAAYAPQLDGVVAVGAIGRSQRRAPYSSTGSYVDLAAPGGDFDDGGRDGIIWQVSLFFPDFFPAPEVIRPRFDRYQEIGEAGTSMAAPHVAGLAALVRSQGITNAAAIEAAMKQFAIDLGVAGRDNEFGYGLINPRATLRGMGLLR